MSNREIDTTDIVSMRLIYAAQHELQRRVTELERARDSVVINVAELREALEQAIAVCDRILELSRDATKGPTDATE